MKLKLMLMILLMIGISFAANRNVDGEFDIPSYEANNSVNFTSTCFNQGSPCNATAQCNTTIYYPNLSILVENRTMSLMRIGLFNLSISENLTNQTGVYHGYVTCIDLDDSDIVGADDGSFRVVDRLLYHGGGIPTFEIAVGLGLALAAMVATALAVFGKSLWLRTLMLFMALTTIIIQSDLFIKIATLDGQAGGVIGSLEAFYFLVVFMTIITLGLFLVNLIWDIAESLGTLPKWTGKLGKKKETLED